MNRNNLNQIPSSWYAVGFSKDLQPESVKAVEFGNQSLVIFRTNTHEVSVFDAYCPHLGAHLGVGGKVQGNIIRCPFHGISYDNKGNCLHKNYSIQPLTAWPVIEKQGIIFVYYGEKTPIWSLPNHEFATSGWTSPRSYVWDDLIIHPENFLDNNVFGNHFGALQCSELTLEGPKITGTISQKYKKWLLLGHHQWLEYEMNFIIMGLGYYFVETLIPTMGLKMRMMFLPTPVSINNMKFYMQTTVYKQFDRFKNLMIYKLIPKNLIFNWMAKNFFKDVLNFLEKNILIRNIPNAQNKKNIALFRAWSKQFYVKQNTI